MVKNILYLLVIIAAFVIILLNQSINIVVKIIALLTMLVGGVIMIESIVKDIQDRKADK